MKRKSLTIITAILLFLILCFNEAKISAATENSKAGIVDASGSSLNVRASSSTSASIITKLSDGSYLTLISKANSWWYIEYANNKYGYVHSDYVNEMANSYAMKTTASLNVRTGAGTNYSIKTTLASGAYVIVVSSSDNWCQVVYNGTSIGYVSANYLQSTYQYQTIKLGVISYKQYDSRWASTSIGQSGKTISQIGCVTTCFAMTESYRYGYPITPSEMSKKLSYTADGAVYWPSDYTATTSSTNYLSKIYSILQQGKPVIFGAKKSNGSQHWVVIYGYKESNTLSAANFLVNDPGSSTNTTLANHLVTYPTFYKYFTY